jgi:hypothetical protein
MLAESTARIPNAAGGLSPTTGFRGGYQIASFRLDK